MKPCLSRATGRRLDLSAERIWPPERCVVISGWRCRLDRGVTRRANSVLAADWEGDSLAAAVARASSLYREHGLDPCFQVTEAAEPDRLGKVLEEAGFEREGESLVLTGPVEHPGSAQAENAIAVELKAGVTNDWLDTYQDGRDAFEVKAKEAILRRIGLPTAFAAIGPPQERRAVGVGIIDGPRGWINCMHTRPDFRRGGLARALLGALRSWLRKKGAERLYLQVEADNLAARGLYSSAAFTRIYGYHYRVGR